MIPVARTEKLLIQQIGNELIVYDQVNNTSHCLNPMAASVWELCDGQLTVEDIANLLESNLNLATDENVDMRALVWLALEELERFHLLKEYRTQPIAIPTISRRTVVKTATLVGGFALGSAFPFVKSIAVALPGNAVSTGNPPDKPPQKCEKNVRNVTATAIDTGTPNKAPKPSVAQQMARADAAAQCTCPPECKRSYHFLGIVETITLKDEKNKTVGYQATAEGRCSCL